VADRKRLEEQQTWNNNCEQLARNQQEETERLVKEQQRLRTEVSAIQWETTTSTYLQSTLPKDVPLPAFRKGTPEEAAGGSGGEPPRPPQTKLVLHSPSPEPARPAGSQVSNGDDDMYMMPERRQDQTVGRPPPGTTPRQPEYIATMLTPKEIACLVG